MIHALPTFKDGDIVVNESGAICMYLEDKYSNDSNKLIPTDTKERTQVYQYMFESANIQANVIVPLVYYRWRTKKEDWDQKVIDEGVVKAKEELAFWDNNLKGKEYLVGSKFTMADVFVFPFIAFLSRSGATFSEFPNLKAWYDRLCTRPSVQATWPPHWKESPGQDHLAAL